MDDDQALGAFHGHSASQRLFDRGQQSKEDKGNHDGQQRQQRAQFLAFQVAPDEMEEFHGEEWNGGTLE